MAMVIDTSALLAILKVEPEALAFVDCLRHPGARRISTATLLETRLVVERQLGEAGQAELELLLARAAITAIPLEELHVHWALLGWRRYGKGRHRAGLNFGDCFSYGLAMALDLPLLFKGADFAATDVAPALAS
ncbi:MAG: type II toxin-antitoxin system VapC family toxin [Prochlorococcaceae cyanobacterium]